MSEQINRSGKDQDCVVCAIISHGSENGWISTKEGSFPLTKFCEFLNSIHCHALAGKPKIILTSVSYFYFYLNIF